ncbi:hypothetical protein ACOME3_008257 [Neoechinorhynchus agilis]
MRWKILTIKSEAIKILRVYKSKAITTGTYRNLLVKLLRMRIRDLAAPLEDIQPGVIYDSTITVDECDIRASIKHSDRKRVNDSPSETSKKATVEQKVEETSERVGRRAKGGTNNYKDIRLTPTPSQSIKPTIHFCIDTPSPPQALHSLPI